MIAFLISDTFLLVHLGQCCTNVQVQSYQMSVMFLYKLFLWSVILVNNFLIFKILIFCCVYVPEYGQILLILTQSLPIIFQ